MKPDILDIWNYAAGTLLAILVYFKLVDRIDLSWWWIAVLPVTAVSIATAFDMLTGSTPSDKKLLAQNTEALERIATQNARLTATNMILRDALIHVARDLVNCKDDSNNSAWRRRQRVAIVYALSAAKKTMAE